MHHLTQGILPVINTPDVSSELLFQCQHNFGVYESALKNLVTRSNFHFPEKQVQGNQKKECTYR